MIKGLFTPSNFIFLGSFMPNWRSNRTSLFLCLLQKNRKCTNYSALQLVLYVHFPWYLWCIIHILLHVSSRASIISIQIYIPVRINILLCACHFQICIFEVNSYIKGWKIIQHKLLSTCYFINPLLLSKLLFFCPLRSVLSTW